MASSIDYICGCTYCPSGMAPDYWVIVQGVKSTSPFVECNDCPEANSSWLCIFPNDNSEPTCDRSNRMISVCGTGYIRLTFGPDGSGTAAGSAIFDPSLSFSVGASGLKDCLSAFPVSLINNSSVFCDPSGASGTIVPTHFDNTQFAEAKCVPNSIKVCIQNCVPAPYTGAPTICCQPSQGCDGPFSECFY